MWSTYILYKDDFQNTHERYNTLQAGESSWVSSTPLAIRTLVQGGVVPVKLFLGLRIYALLTQTLLLLLKKIGFTRLSFF
jgi:hypothetical protein